VEWAFGADIDYAQRVKHYGEGPEAETLYSLAICTGCEKMPVHGTPDPAHISTSYAERHNMRMQMRGFTRLTTSYSKKVEHHVYMVALYAVWYNWIRTHKAHRMIPTMAAGLTDKLMEFADIVRLIDDAEMQRTIRKRVEALGVIPANHN
jgi:hypothetical protein